MRAAEAGFAALEQARTGAVSRARARRELALAISFATLAAAAILVFGSNDERLAWLAILALPALIFAWTWQQGPIRAYRREAAAALYPIAAQRVSDGLVYAAKGGIDPKRLRAAGLLPPHDDADYSHHVQGSYRGVDAAFCAAHLTRTETTTTTDSRGRTQTETRTVTVFQGLYARFVLSRPLPARVYLRRDGGFLENLFGGGPGKTERVRVEDPDFERRFTLFSDDQVGARVLFTTTFMQRVMRADAFAEGGRLEASFEGNEVLLQVPRRQPALKLGNVTKPDRLRSEAARLSEEMGAILGLADTLGLTDQASSS